jgi:alcohol dehydrogenase (cytochrome c)
MKTRCCLFALLITLSLAGQEWNTYGGNVAGWRFSPFDQINARTVARLAPRWVYQTNLPGSNETTPLIFDGMLFATGSSNQAFALDLKTGKPVWRYSHQSPKGLDLCCGEVNRGFARLGNRLFKVNIEDHLIALDAQTGSLLWDVELADYRKGYTGTAAPLVVKNLVITGTSGAEFGIRGFIDAYDAATGKRVWRFNTVPQAGERGAETWGPASAIRLGGSTWITGTYDPTLNLIYWGTGNPGPDLDGDNRPGDNLYTCSMLALDADTGALRWHFQYTPHDLHDWDAVSDPVLVDIPIQGRQVKALIQANRNGHFYALDRENGTPLVSAPYTEVNWTTGIGKDFRPVLNPGKEPSEAGVRVCPGLGGGHNWQATAWNPGTGMFYFGSTEQCQIYYKSKHGFVEGQWFQLSTVDDIPGERGHGSVIAVDPTTGKIAWRYPMLASPSGGLLTTAGGLVFVGDAYGYLVALDAKSGKPVWRFQTGASIHAPAVSYLFEGKQYIAIAAGSSIYAFALVGES